ncbi:Beta-lactamase domain-containing protein [Fusarium keratoplasticum]|uniref:Beta-lactamase domain-containing protein n=1 Tax=Fusarium keratoplasticum TaxID=1328300 RepID=A0ACC0QM95_9HYPO|nr:Beta-lactamase domain-containing protein [Fusarium keratoplasticum]KAI8657861.1 Beta-lactamase domain-containing protein [Fusarium keratoplasticum]
MLFKSTLLPLVLMLVGDGLAAKNNHCPPLGPVLPAPTSPSTNNAVKTAVKTLTEGLKALTGSFNNTAMSIGMVSLHEDEPILNLHHTPANLDARGVKEVDAHTVYRIGSVSKAFTVLAALKLSGVRMDDPVTKYLPRLRKLGKQQDKKNSITVVDWDRISLQALASHMGGIPADLATDLASFPIDWTKLGLPEAKDVLGCIGFSGVKACTVPDFWANFGKRSPVYSPWSSPIYSNVAFLILGLVIEEVSGQKFEDFVQEKVLDVAGMTSTTYTKPEDSVGAISPGDVYWNATLGILDPAGGYYSSTKDLLAFGSSILKNKQLTLKATHKWLKPVSFTTSRGMFLGAPWEIMRSDNVTSDERLVEFYTKGGDLGTYHALVAMIPDYDIVISILTGGPETSGGAVQLLFSQVVTTMLPAIEAAGKAQAKASFAGKYINKETNSTLVLEVDDEGPGLNIAKWTVRGTDVSSHWLNYLSAISSSLPEIQVSARLYPTDLAAGEKVAWRAAYDLGSPEEIAQADAQLFWKDASCLSWGMGDRAVHEFKALDEMVFTVEEGRSTGVELVGFQTILRRVG